MVKGVNKSVIEISDTGNECFERAILFVRPEKEQSDGDNLRRHAGEYLSGLRLRPHFYTRKSFWLASLKLGVAAIAGAAIATGILIGTGLIPGILAVFL